MKKEIDISDFPGSKKSAIQTAAKSDIEAYLNAIWQDGDVREIRAIAYGKKDIVRGYFDNVASAAIAANNLAKTHHVYITLNPCQDELLDRSKNRCSKGESTKDKEIKELRYLLVDIDSERKTNTSATDEEKAACLEIANKVISYLGKPFILGDSGNGYHLIYKHNAKSANELKEMLGHLHKRFSTDNAKIDLAVYNPARISKILGTYAKKGENLPDRPHRKSMILEVSGESIPLDVQSYTGNMPQATQTIQTIQTSANQPAFDSMGYVRKIIAEKAIDVISEKTINGNHHFCLGTCLFNPEHTKNESSIFVMQDGKICYQCFHNTCKDKTWNHVKNILHIEKETACKYCGTAINWMPGSVKPQNIDGSLHICSHKAKISLLDEQIKAESDGEKLARIEQSYVDFLSQYTFSMNTLDDTVYIDGRRFDDTEQSILKNLAYKEIKKLNVDRLLCKIQSNAFQKRFNPIEDFVKNLPSWDGIDRIKQLANCFTIKDNYIGFLFERKLEYFMAKAIKRWSKSEHGICLTLAGGQGIGKSTFFSWLCPLSDYFIAKEVNPDSKDDRLLRCQVMLHEIEELSSTTRKKDVDSLKAFLSCEVIEERKAFGRLPMRKPCKAVFCATVNDNGGFLVDTENRRFLVVCVEKIDRAYEKIDKVQLWSQAKYAFENGKDQLTFEEKAIQQYENNLAKVESSIEIVVLSKYEITGDENDFVPASELLTILTDEKISVRGNDMAAALIGLGVKRMRKGTERIRGYSGLKRKKTEIETS